MIEILVVLSFGLAAACGALLFQARRRERESDRRAAHLASRLEELELAMARFAPMEVVDRLAGGDEAVAPCRRTATVLFADLKGFTALSESLDPALIVEILNEYFRDMDAAIRAHHGHVSKFMGDGIMALFGVLDRNPWQAVEAVRAALAMRAALCRTNERLATRGLAPLHFGVGVHTGELVAGVMGSDRLREYTVIGDVVNVAARVESLTRQHGVDVLVTEPVRAALDGRFRVREMPPATVKGKSEPVRTWAVEGMAD